MKHLASAAFVMAALITPAFAQSGAVCKPAQGADVSKADYPIGFSGLGIKNTSSAVLPIVCPGPIADKLLISNNWTHVTWTTTNPSAQMVCALKSLDSKGTVLRSNFGSGLGNIGDITISQSGINGTAYSVDCQLPPGATLNTVVVNVIG